MTDISIVDFTANYRQAFRDLNYEWIEKYFAVEESDRKMLENPQGYIIDKGGAVLIALLNGEPVGTCALIKMDDEKYELAKMAVSPKAQGKKIGYLLGEATLEKARELGGKMVYLETNSSLTPAINLYKKLGFSDTCGNDSPYSRCDVQMEIEL
ncbi:MAG: GNAT family N-acetyltransferase [Bacteroidota bacterium]